MNIISLVSYPFLPARSGGQKGIALFYKYFSRFHSVTVITTQKNDPSFAEGYEVRNIVSNSVFRYINPFLVFTISKCIREKKANGLILEHPYYGWLGIVLKKICNIRLVVHSHNIESIRWKSLGKWWWRILWQYEKMTHRQADYNFFIQDADREYAIRSFGLDATKCLTVSFGTEISSTPSFEEKRVAKNTLSQILNVPGSMPLLFFNGAFGYPPNREALENILFQVNPLLQNSGLSYLLLIAGLDIPKEFETSQYPSVRILGFVDNLELYLTGSQVFLNPVVSGGGIKTKLVEALAYGLSAVSSVNGAVGIDPVWCNEKLVVCPDQDWNAFAKAIHQVLEINRAMSPVFYDHFYWVPIAQRAADFIR
jgi:polysaccharide biosynthesis protein PslH